jgi:hypothetical protein
MNEGIGWRLGFRGDVVNSVGVDVCGVEIRFPMQNHFSGGCARCVWCGLAVTLFGLAPSSQPYAKYYQLSKTTKTAQSYFYVYRGR